LTIFGDGPEDELGGVVPERDGVVTEAESLDGETNVREGNSDVDVVDQNARMSLSARRKVVTVLREEN
jgi:hypothetical protein